MSYFDKGEFKKIDKEYLKEGIETFNIIAKFLQKYGKTDIDSCFNEFHDSYIGNLFGFENVNTSKHGFDVKSDRDTFLESKVASYFSSQWKATFNDTTLEKCDYFGKNNVYLSLSIWKNINECVCVVYGKTCNIADYLKEKVCNFLEGNGIRSTQNIPMIKLVRDYNFEVFSVNNNKEALLDLLIKKNKNWKKIPIEKIRNINELHNL